MKGEEFMSLKVTTFSSKGRLTRIFSYKTNKFIRKNKPKELGETLGFLLSSGDNY